MNEFDEERFIQDEIHNSNRSPFERDRARIFHSSALRRLGTKTQVLGAGFDDFVRTRLTHTLEVAQVGRDLANMLGANADIVDAACLSHDLGHPPFGHSGETILNSLAKDFGGFEGNAQTLRILTRLEPKIIDSNGKSAGLNLTRATLDATIKYPWKKEVKIQGEANLTKFNYYEDDREVFDWIRLGIDSDNINSKCLEAQIMDLADDISYCVHDTEDGIVSSGIQMSLLNDRRSFEQVVQLSSSWYGNLITESDLANAVKRLDEKGYLSIEFDKTFSSLAKLKNLTSSLIGRFATSALNATKERFPNSQMSRYNAKLIVPKDTIAEIQLLKAFIATFVMQTSIRLNAEAEHKEVIECLYNKFIQGVGMDKSFTDLFENAKTETERNRIVVDQIACLTDSSAIRLATEL